MDSEVGQMRLIAGRDDKRAVMEEASDSPVIKEEVDNGEMWRYGGCSTKNKLDCGENPEAKRMKLTPAMEFNVIQQGVNYEVKGEVEPFPAAVVPKSIQAGSHLFAKLQSDNQVFNAHDFFTNEAIVNGELKEDEEEQDDVEMDQPAENNDLEKEDEKDCPVYGCHEKCDSDDDLKRHMLKHPLPLLCRVCEKTSKTASKLREHYRVHSGYKPFECSACERKFSQSSSLKVHMRQHTGELPFECDECARKFAHSSALKYHQATTHTGEKAFACSLCDYRSASSSSLTDHIRSHTGEKPFECSDCEKCFSRNQHLEKHKAAVHEGIKKYSCTECDYKSAQKSTLNRHIKRMHKK